MEDLMSPTTERKAAALVRAWKRGDAFTCDNAAEVVQRATELVLMESGAQEAQRLREAVSVRADHAWLPDKDAFHAAIFGAFVVLIAGVLLGMMWRDYDAEQDAAAVAEVGHER
jgi:hypothetical protein